MRAKVLSQVRWTIECFLTIWKGARDGFEAGRKTRSRPRRDGSRRSRAINVDSNVFISISRNA